MFEPLSLSKTVDTAVVIEELGADLCRWPATKLACISVWAGTRQPPGPRPEKPPVETPPDQERRVPIPDRPPVQEPPQKDPEPPEEEPPHRRDLPPVGPPPHPSPPQKGPIQEPKRPPPARVV